MSRDIRRTFETGGRCRAPRRASFAASSNSPFSALFVPAAFIAWLLALLGAARPSSAGETNCATANCHGNAATRDSQIWKRSAILFATRDPHRQAFDALYNDRSRAMLQRLAELDREPDDELAPNRSATRQVSDSSRAGEVRGDRDGEISAAEYDRLVEQRCIGCHATPLTASAPRGALKTGDVVKAGEAWRRADGVSCEACHGRADRWLEAHYSREWPNRTDAERLDRFGFAPTRALHSRAAICVECHVGPRFVDDRLYRVDHDLIAAGHPRLDFEFSSALANLPPHWDTAVDRTRHGRNANSASFDSDAFLLGQRAIAAALLRLDQLDSESGAGADWSRLQCFDCHRRLRATTPPTTPALSMAKTTALSADSSVPKPSVLEGPSSALERQALRRSGEPRRWNAPWQVVALELAVRGTPVAGAPNVEWLELAQRGSAALTAEQRRQFLSRWGVELTDGEWWSWDGAAGFDLAVAAWLADRGPSASPSAAGDASILETRLRRVAREYREALDRCFTPDSPSRYHSPDLWLSRSTQVRERLEALRQAIEEVDGGVPRAAAETGKDDP